MDPLGDEISWRNVNIFVDQYTFEFTPKPNHGSKYPKHQNKLCYGKDLTKTKTIDYLNLKWLIVAYHNTAMTSEFFNSFFTKLAGTEQLQQQIESGLTAKEIKATWENGLEAFKKVRAQYLIYP